MKKSIFKKFFSIIAITTFFLVGKSTIKVNAEEKKPVITQAVASGYFSVLLSDEGNVYTFGYGVSGQLGTGNTSNKNLPVNITSSFGGETIVKLFGGVNSSHTIALSASGKIFAWGANSSGQCGVGNVNDQRTPVDITDKFEGETISQVGLGSNFTVVLTESNKVYTFGENEYGQLGIGNTTDKSTPTDITDQFGDEVVTNITVGGFHTLAMTESGKLYAFGYNSNYGQLGIGEADTANKLSPIDISYLFPDETIVQTGANYLSSFVLCESGKIFAFGSNATGQLGKTILVYNTIERSPVETTSQFGDDKIVKMNCGGEHNMFFGESGKIYAFGRNNQGQLGLGTTSDSVTTSTPIDITEKLADINIETISMGSYHNLIIDTAGVVHCFGGNNFGQLGIGSTVSDGKFSNVVFKYSQAKLTSETTTFNKAMGDSTFTLSVNGGTGSGALSYISSNTTVATVNSSGVVTIKTPGTAKISVIKAEDTTYDVSNTLVFTINVAKGNQANITTSNLTINKVMADSYFYLSTLVTGGTGSGALTYESANTDIVSVATNGKVTIHALGTTTLTVYKAGDSNYEDSNTLTFTVNINKPSQTNIASDQLTITKNLIDSDFNLVVTGGNGTGALSYVSSDTTVVEVDSTGKVTIIGAGTATISAIKAGDDNYNVSNELTFNITIVKKTQAVITANETSISKVVDTLEFDLTVNGGSGSGALSYTSSDTTVVEVDSTGKVTIIGAGTATITVKKLQDDEYADSNTLTFNIIITKMNQTNITTSNPTIDKLTTDDNFNLVVNGGNGDGAFTYTSNNPLVAEVSPTGVVTIIGVGITVITVTKATDALYNVSNTLDITINVSKANQANLTSEYMAYTKTLSDLQFTISVTGGSGSGAITYSSSNTDVVTVDQFGTVTIIGAGNATINVLKAANDTYAISSVLEIAITISKNPQEEIITSTTNFTKTEIGEEFTLDITGGTGTGSLSYTSSNTDVVTVDQFGKVTVVGKGTATVTVVNVGDDTYGESNTLTFTITVGKESNNGLSVGAIIGIVVASLFGLLLVIVVVYILWKYAILKGHVLDTIFTPIDVFFVKVCRVFYKKNALFTMVGIKNKEELKDK